MVLEVEVKAPVGSARAVMEALSDLGANPVSTVDQSDAYYAHPCRDLAARDEAFRVRQWTDGTELTWKGPKLDEASKTRVEHTVAIADRSALDGILAGLGFEPVATVSKERSLFEWHDWTICLDQVDGLGSFVEVERTVPDAATGERDRLVREAHAILDRLGAGEPERRSYLELLIEARG